MQRGLRVSGGGLLTLLRNNPSAYGTSLYTREAISRLALSLLALLQYYSIITLGRTGNRYTLKESIPKCDAHASHFLIFRSYTVIGGIKNSLTI